MEPEKQSVFEELDRITASEDFRNKPVMRKLLAYLVTECVEGRSDQIKGYTIGLDVFGQGNSFDPNRSALVRNNAVRLRALLKTYYLGIGKKDPVVIDIPKGKYVPQFSTNNAGGKDLSGVEISTARASRPPTVGVLPFRNRTHHSKLNYLATGFSRELADALTKFEFRVLCFDEQFEGDALRDKGVEFLVAGDVAAVGNQVKVSFRLVNAMDGSQLWGESVRFNIEEDDLFEIQERVTGRVASLVGGEYGRVNQFRYQAMLSSRPRSLSEHDILLKHYHHVTVLTDESMVAFHDEVFAALEKDPDSAVLNAIASGFYQNMWAFSGANDDHALQQFARLAEKAYSLNPNHQVVLSNLGGKCFIFNEKDRFIRLYEQSREWLANSPLRLGSWALHMCLFGEWERGKKLLDKVFENNLHVPLWLHGINCLYYFRLHDYETALVEANKFQIPGLFWGPAYRIAVLAHLGRLPEAKKEFATLLEWRPDFVENGRRLMGCYIREDGLLDQILEGFENIGVKLA